MAKSSKRSPLPLSFPSLLLLCLFFFSLQCSTTKTSEPGELVVDEKQSQNEGRGWARDEHEDSDHDHEDSDEHHDDHDDHDHEDSEDHDDHDHDDHGDDHDHDDHGDDHDHDDHSNEATNFTINGEEVSSPGVYQIIERFDLNNDGYLSFEEFELFYDEVMAAASGGEDSHDDHGHRRRRSVSSLPSSEMKVTGPFAASLLVGVYRGRVGSRALRQDDGHEGHDHGDCESADELFHEFDLDEDGYLSSVEVLLVCPDMIVQILDGCASTEEDDDCEPISKADAWLYGMLSTFGISLLSVIGVFLIPIHNEKVKEYLVNSLIAFAVGALFGDVILHIIPHALGIHSHGEVLDSVGGGRVTRELWLMLVVCAGFLLFMVLELAIRGAKALIGGEKGADEEVSGEKNTEVEKKSSNMMRKMAGLDEEKKRYRDIQAVGYLNLVSDGLHNFIDGITLGVAWTDSVDLGLSTTIAVIAHEVPQELGDFGILVHAGFTKWQAILWNLTSASLAMLGAIIGLAVGTSADKATPWLLALAAGNFLYISLVSMMPQVLENITDVKSGVPALFLIALGISVLFIIAVFEDEDC